MHVCMYVCMYDRVGSHEEVLPDAKGFRQFENRKRSVAASKKVVETHRTNNIPHSVCMYVCIYVCIYVCMYPNLILP